MKWREQTQSYHFCHFLSIKQISNYYYFPNLFIVLEFFDNFSFWRHSNIFQDITFILCSLDRSIRIVLCGARHSGCLSALWPCDPFININSQNQPVEYKSEEKEFCSMISSIAIKLRLTKSSRNNFYMKLEYQQDSLPLAISEMARCLIHAFYISKRWFVQYYSHSRKKKRVVTTSKLYNEKMKILWSLRNKHKSLSLLTDTAANWTWYCYHWFFLPLFMNSCKFYQGKSM